MKEKIIWLVEWEDLSACFETKAAAIKYFHDEAERIGASYTGDLDEDILIELSVTYESGEKGDVYIYEIPFMYN